MPKGLRKLVESYVNKQKHKVVEFYQDHVVYSINNKRSMNCYRGEEEFVRAYLIAKLVNELDYDPEKIEIEVQYQIGRPSRSAAEVDIIARDTKGNAFLFIEVKAPYTYKNEREKAIKGQLFDVAWHEYRNNKVKYLVYYTLDFSSGSLKDECTVIDFEKFKDYDTWNKKGQDFSNEIPKIGGKSKKRLYTICFLVMIILII